MPIRIIDITNEVKRNTPNLHNFISGLDKEKKHINLDIDRVLRSKMVLVAMDQNKIIGIAGFESKYKIFRSYIIVKKGYQRRGIGHLLLEKLLTDGNAKYGLVVARVERENEKSIKFHERKGYQMVGKRRRIVYMMKPLSFNGLFLCHLFTIFFPFFHVLDFLRSFSGIKLFRSRP